MSLPLQRRHLLSLLASTPLLCAWTTPSEASERNVALDRVKKARAGLKTLRAEFKQERHIGLLATRVKSTGTIAIVRPDRLRWQLHAPDAVTYWIGPEGVAIATKEGVSKVGRKAAGHFAAVLTDLMQLLAGDIDSLGRRYQLDVTRSPTYTSLNATPKDAALKKQITRLTLRLKNHQLWAMDRAIILEKNGDHSDIVFSNPERNVAIDPKAMRPPKG
jgi:outer membrane lipoprotein-sorting protein